MYIVVQTAAALCPQTGRQFFVRRALFRYNVLRANLRRACCCVAVKQPAAGNAILLMEGGDSL